MESIFSKIINGVIPGHFITQNDQFVAILDAFPLAKGHVLVVPREEIDYLFDIDDDLLAEMMIFAKKIAKAIGAAIPCTKVGVCVVGLEVPHAHIHLIPINSVSDMDFSKPKLKVDADEMQDICQRIKKFYQK